jgi:hypothetical protein
MKDVQEESGIIKIWKNIPFTGNPQWLATTKFCFDERNFQSCGFTSAGTIFYLVLLA